MSKIIASAAIRGAHSLFNKAETALESAIAAKGETEGVAFPDTAYFLPVTYALTGQKAKTLGDLRAVIETARELLPEIPSDHVWLPYLGNALDAGVAALLAEEIIESVKYVVGPQPVNGIWLGATDCRSVSLKRRWEFESLCCH